MRIEKIRTPGWRVSRCTIRQHLMWRNGCATYNVVVVTAIAEWNWSSWISVTVMPRVVRSTLFLDGSGRRTIEAWVARLALLLPNFRKLVPNNTSWPQNFRLALFQDGLGPLQELDLTTLGPVSIVATSLVVLSWLCDSPRTGCAWRITP